ncbi:MAG: hypothetical protein LBT67_01205 [Holosporaceae bacterium]|jgi:hypothetical protein|nr:hypothetical protein [Holosporaceae bacterium]
MVSLKNNTLGFAVYKELCEIHGVKLSNRNKTKLTLQKSRNFTRSRYLLKPTHPRRPCTKITDEAADSKLFRPENIDILSRRYVAVPFSLSVKNHLWVSEVDVVEWLLQIGVQVKRLPNQLYVLMGKVCLPSHVIIFANRKRVDMGQRPFYVDGLTEF